MEKTILLVDDEEGIRKVLGISLADAGYVTGKTLQRQHNHTMQQESGDDCNDNASHGQK